MDKLIKKTNLALVVGTNSWREQFIEAITVSAGECLSLHVTNSNDQTALSFSPVTAGLRQSTKELPGGKLKGK